MNYIEQALDKHLSSCGNGPMSQEDCTLVVEALDKARIHNSKSYGYSEICWQRSYRDKTGFMRTATASVFIKGDYITASSCGQDGHIMPSFSLAILIAYKEYLSILKSSA